MNSRKTPRSPCEKWSGTSRRGNSRIIQRDRRKLWKFATGLKRIGSRREGGSSPSPLDQIRHHPVRAPVDIRQHVRLVVRVIARPHERPALHHLEPPAQPLLAERIEPLR